MLADANMSIRRSNEAALRRRNALLSRRHPIDVVDGWLGEVETLIEHNCPVVPEGLMTEIAAFLGRLDTRLWRLDARLSRRLRRNAARETSIVLDVLFEAQELLLLRLAATA
jgi:hypothetical protein